MSTLKTAAVGIGIGAAIIVGFEIKLQKEIRDLRTMVFDNEECSLTRAHTQQEHINMMVNSMSKLTEISTALEKKVEGLEFKLGDVRERLMK